MKTIKANHETNNVYFFPLSHRLEVRAQVAQAFLAKFQLSAEETATLRRARDAPITEVNSIMVNTNELRILPSARKWWKDAVSGTNLWSFGLLVERLYYLDPLVEADHSANTLPQHPTWRRTSYCFFTN